MIRSFRSRNRTRTKGRIIAIIDDGGEVEVPVIPTIAVTWSAGFEDGVVPADTLVDTIVAQVDVTPSNSTWFLSAENNIVYRDGVVLRLARAVTFPADGTFELDLEVTGTTDVLLTEFMVVADATPTAFRYIMPVAAGLGNGTSWANAAALTGLNGQIASTLADGEIWIRGDAGTYTLSGSIALTNGSTDGHAKQIRGVDVDGNDHLTDIINTRTDWTLPADPETVTSTTGWNAGLDVMRLQTGANNLTFKFVGFRRVSYGFYIRNAIRNLTIEDCDAYNVRRYLETEATITGLVIRRPTVVGFSKQCIRLDAATNDVLIEDFDLNSGRQADDAFAAGIACDNGSTCHDILIRNGVISNCHYSSNASDVSYQNADGISTEGSNYDVTIQDVEVYGCTDGGVDLKGGTPDGPIVCTRVNSHNNKRNFRLWCWGTVDDCVSTDPELRGSPSQSGNVPTHLGLYSADADVLVTGFAMTDSFAGTQRFAVESSGAVLRLDDVTDNSLSILDYIEIGAFDPLIYNPTNAADTAVPVWTADTTNDVDEGLTLNVPLTNTTDGGENVKFVLVSASDGLTLSAADDRDGTVNLAVALQDYESLTSPDLTAVIDVYNSKRVKARTTITVTINDVGGDTGGTVSTSTSHGWRWDQPVAPAGITLSGSENKTATRSSGGSNATVRGTTGMFPPVQYKTYFEAVPSVIGSAATFAVGLTNLSELDTVALGTTNHSIGYFADGSIKFNGVTVATGATYAATNVIGVATTLNNWDWDDVRDNPSHIHDWKARSVAFYKNGTLQATVNISTLTDALYPAVSLFTTNDAAAVRSASTEWTQTPPASHAAWGTVSKLSVTGNGAARYVTPTGTGTGVSWAAAAGPSQIPALIRSLGGSGGTNPHLFIRADLGRYDRGNTALTITGGGAASNNPVVVTGVDVNLIPTPCHFYGNRTVWVLPNDPTQETTGTNTFGGTALFNLSTGAQNITFQQFHSRRQLCAVNLKADCTGIIVQDASFYNNRRGLFESDALKSSNGLILRRFHGTGFSKQGSTIKGTTTGALVQNFWLNGGRMWNDAGYSGVKFDDTASGTVSTGYVVQVSGDTGNLGDGVETNNGNPNVAVEDLVIYQARDGGIDSKSDGGTIARCLAYECTRNFKVWGDQMVHQDNFSWNPVASAYQSVFHQGQDAASNILWYRHRMYNPGSIYLQNWNQTSRFIDGKRIDEASAFAVNALPTGVTQTIDSGAGTGRLMFGLSTDVTGPTITSAATKNATGGQTFSHTLTASENCTWYIVGGTFEGSASYCRVYNSTFDIEKFNAQSPVLRFKDGAIPVYDEDTPANNIKTVTVRATDSVGNTTDQVITITITPVVTVPNWTAIWTFEGTNNSTTFPVDTVGGKAITSIGGAKLTTTSPLSGSSSLFCDGVDDRASSPDHADWWFDGMFVIEALFRANALNGGTILSQYQVASGLRSWTLNVTAAGELSFTWSFDGTAAASLTTSGLGLVTGTNYLARVDRDSLGVIRIYAAPGAATSIPMVAKVTGVTTAFRNSTVNLVVGGNATSGGGTLFSGVIDKVRIEKGNAPEASDSGFTITASGDESLWPSSTPLTVVDMATGVTAGTVFHVTEGSTLKAIRFYRGNASVASTFEAAINTTGVLPTAYTAAVYSSSSTALATKSVTGQTTVGGWITITFDTPVALSVGVDYTACVFQAAVSGSVYYPAQAGVFDSSATVVSASTAIVGTSGLIGFGASLAKPSNAVGNTAYFIDPVVTF